MLGRRELSDGFLAHRMEHAKHARPLRELKVPAIPSHTVESNRETISFPKEVLEIHGLTYTENAYKNFLHAIESGYIEVRLTEEENVEITYLPVTDERLFTLGHLCSLESWQAFQQKPDVLFGPQDSHAMTYLQTTDFVVEPNFDDQGQWGRSETVRVYIDGRDLLKKRDVFLDPESLSATEYEYGYAFVVYGGIPAEAIAFAEVVGHVELEDDHVADSGEWPTMEEIKKQWDERAAALLAFLKQRDQQKHAA